MDGSGHVQVVQKFRTTMQTNTCVNFEAALNFQTNPKNLVAVLAPCIRPPHYEVDFAKTIRDQALLSGVLPENFHDCGLCTASNHQKFYSYRREEGKTGRHLALLGHYCS